MREELRVTKEALNIALKRIEELEAPVKEKSKPFFVKEDVRHYAHKSGQKEGHEGVSRETPEQIDEVRKLDIKECPDCGTKLSKIQRKRKRVKARRCYKKNIKWKQKQKRSRDNC